MNGVFGELDCLERYGATGCEIKIFREAGRKIERGWKCCVFHTKTIPCDMLLHPGSGETHILMLPEKGIQGSAGMRDSNLAIRSAFN